MKLPKDIIADLRQLGWQITPINGQIYTAPVTDRPAPIPVNLRVALRSQHSEILDALLYPPKCRPFKTADLMAVYRGKAVWIYIGVATTYLLLVMDRAAASIPRLAWTPRELLEISTTRPKSWQAALRQRLMPTRLPDPMPKFRHVLEALSISIAPPPVMPCIDTYAIKPVTRPQCGRCRYFEEYGHCAARGIKVFATTDQGALKCPSLELI